MNGSSGLSSSANMPRNCGMEGMHTGTGNQKSPITSMLKKPFKTQRQIYRTNIVGEPLILGYKNFTYISQSKLMIIYFKEYK